MRLYSYVMTHDTGFAPNPDHGVCTLATCKGPLRLSVAKAWMRGERELYVMGTGGKTLARKTDAKANGRVIYLMKVTDVVDYGHYSREGKFECKKPDGPCDKTADNIYMPLGDGFDELYRCVIPNGAHNSEEEWERDWRGKYVLISAAGDFYYWGKEGPQIKELVPRGYGRFLKKGPCFKILNNDHGVSEGELYSFIGVVKEAGKEGGKLGEPHGK